MGGEQRFCQKQANQQTKYHIQQPQKSLPRTSDDPIPKIAENRLRCTIIESGVVAVEKKIMSLRTFQERLVQLQETTSQIRTLIDRLGSLKLQPGSVPLGDDSDSHYDDGNVVTELGVEITQGLRETEEDLDLLREEVADLKPGRDGSEAQKDRNRLRESADRLGAELKRYVILPVSGRSPLSQFRFAILTSLVYLNTAAEFVSAKRSSQPVNA